MLIESDKIYLTLPEYEPAIPKHGKRKETHSCNHEIVALRYQRGTNCGSTKESVNSFDGGIHCLRKMRGILFLSCSYGLA